MILKGEVYHMLDIVDKESRFIDRLNAKYHFLPTSGGYFCVMGRNVT